MPSLTRVALVTGAHGFIGRRVARRLAAGGWRVVGLGHGRWPEAEQRDFGIAEWIESDIGPESLARCATPGLIVHCAGSGSVAASLADPHGEFQRTVATTSAVLDVVRRGERGIRLVYPSSPAVCGATSADAIAESAEVRPVSPYGMHKSIAEQLCRFYARHYAIPVAVVRLFSVYGAGLRKQLLWDACNKIVRGNLTFFGTGTEFRDWLHVEDAVSLLVRAAEHAAPSCPTVNGGSGVGTANHDIVGALARLLGSAAMPTFNGESRPGDPPRYVADIALARRWGWEPAQPLNDGLAEYVAWFKALA
jgi:UDP-glucose 4-epimerase